MYTPLAYLQESLKVFPSYLTTEQDKHAINTLGKEKWITLKLLRKKFRKTKIYEQTEQDILKKVTLSIEKNTPLFLITLFGGYKHFWNPSYPEIDWAEFFNLSFMSEYFAPVLAEHQPGVIFEYGSEDVIMNLMDNYPKKDLDIYAHSFQKLIELYYKTCRVPNNYKINYVRTGQTYNSERLISRIKELLPDKKIAWQKLSPEEREKRLHRSYRSMVWKGEKDLTSFSEKEKEERIEESKIIEDTFYEIEAEFVGDYFTGGNHIPIVLSWGLTDENVDHWLTLGSTYASSVDFWIGRGLLEDRGDRFIPRVVSKEQYEKVKAQLKTEKINLLPLKNFQEIEIYSGALDFKQ